MAKLTAGIIIIGDEILSGRTLDLNTQEIALALRKKNINVAETRIIADQKSVIANYVQEFSQKYNYVFTTGGIGPTHDDITAEAIAFAFNLPYVKNTEIINIIKDNYPEQNININKAREKMAYLPKNASLLHNKATKIPGFFIHNVFSLAGMPDIMKSMLDSALKYLDNGPKIHSKTFKLLVSESKIAIQLANLQKNYQSVSIGSYPFCSNNQIGTELVVTSQDELSFDQACKKLEELKTTMVL